MIGTSLFHYRITEKLGAGGMGEVYRAEDTNLHRHVAIKVLPDEFASDPERLARFEREAKVLASLNHPNIAAIHGLEQADGKRFLVLELVEGQTLAQRLLKGPLPVEEALEVCRQIAEGLEAAHEKGVIHRDLKPANIQITSDGKVKILDFGLARAFHDQPSEVDQTHSPTITEAMTRPGVVLGTAAYMSPEQAKGKAVDKRVDIWGFGCVLYECLTGKAPFKGETVTETVAKILEGTPDWNALPQGTPWRAQDVLQRCLARNPRERLHDIGDARIEMQAGLHEGVQMMPVAQPFPLRWMLISTAALVIGVLIGPAVMRYFRPPASVSQPVVRALIRIEPGQWLAGMGGQPEFWRPSRTAVAMASDGRFLVYSATEGDPSPQAVPRLYLRRTDQLEAKPITGTEGGFSPFLSPDDRWVGFWASGKLLKVSVEGGVPANLCDVAAPFGASWGPDNKIVFSPEADVGLFSVSAEGGVPQALTNPDKTNEEYSHRLPRCLPDGKGVLFTIMKEMWDTRPSVALLDLKTRKWRVLMKDGADAIYIPMGRIVFVRRGTLMTAPFDLNRSDLTGQPVPAIANVMQGTSAYSFLNSCAGQFSISASGWLIYVAGGVLPDMENSLVWVDQGGNAEPTASFKGPFGVPRLSPDGQKIAYNTAGEERRLNVYDTTRGTLSQVASDGKSFFPTWTPDGKRLVFGWWKSGQPNLHWQLADGSTPMERLTASGRDQYPGSVTPEGDTLAFVEWRPDTFTDILLLDLRSRQVKPFLNSRAEETYPAFSRDGRWLAYVSDESGREEVYLRPFPNPGGKWKLSLEGGTEPLWARNGKQLFYRWRDQVWVVDVRTDTGFTPGRPHLLFEKPGYRMSNPIGCWDISPDGKRFLMVKLDERKPQPVTELILVQNWFEELKRLVPTGKK